jgi:hypothetical protein
MFDGTYIVEFVNSPRAFDANVQRNGDPIIKSNFRIVEVIRRPEYSGVTYNDRGEAVPWTAEMGEVEEGTDRDHVVWPKSGEPAAAEFKGLIQDRVVFLRGGVPGTFTKEEAAELLGPGQPMAGVRAKLTVSTEPQDKDSRKGFTHFRYRYLSKAADRVEDLVAQSMPTAPAMPAALAERFAAAKRPGFVPPEGA